MSKTGGLVLVALTAVAGVMAPTSTGLAQRSGACGAPGKPPCPLQLWMRTNVAGPLAGRDLPKLAESLDQVRALNPDPARWTNWERFASDGARAAREGDASKAMQSCTRCHDVYRARYGDLFRERPISDPRTR